MLENGATSAALKDYDDGLCKEISGVVLRNRGAGPFGILNIVDKRCGSVFEDINDVMSKDEMDEFMLRCVQAAGYAMEALNSATNGVKLDEIHRFESVVFSGRLWAFTKRD